MNTTKQTSLFENGLIWFGASISIAEILTGTSFAPLGFPKGLTAILIGHVIGCLMLFLAGLIGAKTKKSSMETAKISFGQKGSLLFSILNILQLMGWTAIMILNGAVAADSILTLGSPVWCLIIGALIILWIAIGIESLGKLNTITMTALFCLTIILCCVIFSGKKTNALSGEVISFGAAIELSVAMPLSWLPLISDYTQKAARPVGATACSAITYGLASSFMYFIGMSASLFTNESDIAQIMLKAGLGIAGLVIVVFSTVTTTFLDAYSAGISSESIFPLKSGKYFAIGTTIFGTICAIFFPILNISDFLYLIGSVFAPMIAVQIADFYILKKDSSRKNCSLQNLLIWLAGFIIYRLLINIDLITGSTLPDMLITILLSIIVNKLSADR